MKFNKITINNFLSVGEINAELREKGLVLIEGENVDDSSQDSNGSGKSSFADAISWCLYGVTARGETGDSVVNRTAKKDCGVTIEIDSDGELFRIERYRKHKKNKNRLLVFRLDGKAWDEITLGTDKETQKLVEKIIGCSEAVFNAAIYSGQEQMVDLPAMTDKQLKEIVEEAAGIDRLKAALEQARIEVRNAKEAFSRLSYELSTEKRSLEDAEKNLKQAKEFAKDWDDKKVAHARTKAAQLKKLIEDYKEEAAQAPAIKSDLDAVNKNISGIEAKLDALNSEKEKEKELSETLRASQSEESVAKVAVNRIANSLRALKGELENFEDRIGTNCGECGKEYHAEDMENALKATKAKMRTLRTEFEHTRKKLDAATIKVNDSSAALEDYRKSMTDPSAEHKELKKLNTRKHELEEDLECIKDSKESIDEERKALEDLKASANPHTPWIEKHEKRIEEVSEKIADLQEMLDAAERDVQISLDVEKVFSPAGVRAHILDSVTPFLNKRTAEYLSILSDGHIEAVWSTLSTTTKGELREKFNIDVSSSVGADSFKGLSGGEKRKVRLSCSMALQDLVASRASKPIELYVADEIDHALDEAGLERLMTILDEKARVKGTALVISHNPLSDWIRQSVTVVKEGGVSRLKGAAL